MKKKIKMEILNRSIQTKNAQCFGVGKNSIATGNQSEAIVASGSKLSAEGFVTVASGDNENNIIGFSISDGQLYDEAPVAKATGTSINTEGSFPTKAIKEVK